MSSPEHQSPHEGVEDGGKGPERATELSARIGSALEVVKEYGTIEGDHHRAWVLDQVLRALTGDKYDEFVEEHFVQEDPTIHDEEGPIRVNYWDEGIAP